MTRGIRLLCVLGLLALLTAVMPLTALAAGPSAMGTGQVAMSTTNAQSASMNVSMHSGPDPTINVLTLATTADIHGGTGLDPGKQLVRAHSVITNDLGTGFSGVTTTSDALSMIPAMFLRPMPMSGVRSADHYYTMFGGTSNARDGTTGAASAFQQTVNSASAFYQWVRTQFGSTFASAASLAPSG